MYRSMGVIDLACLREQPRWLVVTSGAVVLLAILLAILLTAGSSASSGRPVLAQLSLGGLQMPSGSPSPCAIAVDTEGNIYVSDTGRSKIFVFDDTGKYLGAISNSHAPCGVAVNSKGVVYAIERDTRTVVSYKPAAYPFKGAPNYGAPTVLDATGRAQGISVDPADNRVYVAMGGIVEVFNPDGTLGVNAAQHVYAFEATGGAYRLQFEEDETPPIPFNATHKQAEKALEFMATLGPGSVSVKNGPYGKHDHLITFTGKFARMRVPPLTANPTHLRGHKNVKLLIEGVTEGFDGRVGDGLLADASGVAAYTYSTGTHYLYIADSAGAAPDRIYVFSGNSFKALEERTVIVGSKTPAGGFGFASGGAGLGVDPKTGNVFVYDAKHAVIDEFTPDGEYVAQAGSGALRGDQPPGVAVDRSGGPHDGAVYLTTGPEADVRAFKAELDGTHPRIPNLGGKLKGVCGIAVDSYGDIYVSAQTTIHVYSPQGNEITTIDEPNRPCDLALDSEGNLYTTTFGSLRREGDEGVSLYRPSSYPPTSSTKYSSPQKILTVTGRRWVAVNPANDHLLVNLNAYVGPKEFRIAEFDSARNGAKVISENEIGRGTLENIESFEGGLDVCARSDHIYAAGSGEMGWRFYVLDGTGTRLLTAIDGSGSKTGTFLSHSFGIAVDQSNCHLFTTSFNRPVEEFEPSGGFVSDVGPPLADGDVAVDNGAFSPNRGNVYVASVTRNEWLAFGPLTYGGH